MYCNVLSRRVGVSGRKAVALQISSVWRCLTNSKYLAWRQAGGARMGGGGRPRGWRSTILWRNMRHAWRAALLPQWRGKSQRRTWLPATGHDLHHLLAWRDVWKQPLCST